jgi:protein-disulfide isomerase
MEIASQKKTSMQTRLNWVAIVAALAWPRIALAADASSLKPPPGAKVALVVFEDLQCGDSARVDPLLRQAASGHRIPIVLYEFPLPMHNWSFAAAVWARFFDARSEKVGNQFRKYIYANQTKITFANLRLFIQKFGRQNRIPIPRVNDPGGKLAAKVKDDFALGQHIGLVHTPTVFVVAQTGVSAPLVETFTPDELDQLIEHTFKESAIEASPQLSTKKGAR